ncbi:MAG: M23 family metallopeptidase [Acutalibacteraceae bacterium]|nr:M23 family metallopeptidase [Acutalibacteraceae bacterium]
MLKHKSTLYIFILQTVFLILTVAVLFIIKTFFADLFSVTKENYYEYFGDETVTEPEMVSAKANSFVAPVANGIVTSNYGIRQSPFSTDKEKHYGTDIAAEKGTEILAVKEGKISFVGNDSDGYGNYLKINHSGSLQTLYGHCNEILVGEGEYVMAGQPVATVGSTGRSTGNHLHFEILINGEAVNPVWYMVF